MTLQMQINPTEQVRKLLDRLTQQRDLYKQLQSLSTQQAQFIQDGSAEQLLGVLSQRQSLIDSLARLNAELAPYRERWTQLADAVDPQLREQVRSVIAEIEAYLGEIVQQDEKDKAQLQDAKAKVGSQLSNISAAGRAIKAYGPPKTPPTTPTFTDRQG